MSKSTKIFQIWKTSPKRGDFLSKFQTSRCGMHKLLNGDIPKMALRYVLWALAQSLTAVPVPFPQHHVILNYHLCKIAIEDGSGQMQKACLLLARRTSTEHPLRLKPGLPNWLLPTPPFSTGSSQQARLKISKGIFHSVLSFTVLPSPNEYPDGLSLHGLF